MTQRDVQDHWDSLVSQLGAEPQLSVTPIARKATEEPSRRAVGVPRVRPPSTDWAEVAVQLGVVDAEPIPEARKWRLRETAEPAQPREAPREKPPGQRSSTGFGAGLAAHETPAREESSAAAAEESAVAAAPWLEEIQRDDEPKDRPRRRRRRRSRGERGQGEEQAGGAAEGTVGNAGDVDSGGGPSAVDSRRRSHFERRGDAESAETERRAPSSRRFRCRFR